VTNTASDGVDGAAWRAELERRHAHLANIVDQAGAWAREFHVRIGDGPWGDGSSLRSYPLTAYADTLQRIGVALKVVCANASLHPPGPDWDRTMLTAPSIVTVPGRDPNWRSADYSEGGRYLLGLAPTSPHSHIVTAQEHWRAALSLAGKSVIERELGIPQLETYAAQTQSLFDDAYEVVRAAYRDSVAATYGRFWATSTDRSHSAAPALLHWMRALTDCGVSVEECESVLRDIEVADPDAVAKCRAVRDHWLPAAP
jgi:hypothetical protein